MWNKFLARVGFCAPVNPVERAMYFVAQAEAAYMYAEDEQLLANHRRTYALAQYEVAKNRLDLALARKQKT